MESDLRNMEMQKQETLQGDGKGFCITLSNARDLQRLSTRLQDQVKEENKL